jgi:kynurenine formamidase
LEAAEKLAPAPVRAGDVVLIRSGWGRQFDNGTAAYLGTQTGVPGIGAAGATFLADKRIHAAGADTIAFERLAANAGHGLLPVHRIMLVESGIYLIEAMDLEELAAHRIYEFSFVLLPLKFFGATGSPVRPVAIISTQTIAAAH